MPRQKRADKAGTIYHALNRGNQALTEKELAAVRKYVERGRPFGGDAWAQESGPTRRT